MNASCEICSPGKGKLNVGDGVGEGRRFLTGDGDELFECGLFGDGDCLMVNSTESELKIITIYQSNS